MRLKEKKIVATVIDNSYVKYVYIMIKSLLKNNEIDIIYLLSEEEIDSNNKEILTQLCRKYGCCIIFEYFDLFPDAFFNNNWTRGLWLKILMWEKIPKDINRVVYLDADTLIRGDISELFSNNMQDKCIGGCKDLYVQKTCEQHIREIGIDQNAYINAGVIVFNLRIIRKKFPTIDYFINVASENSKKLIYADQDVINICFNNEIYYYDWRTYNLVATRWTKEEYNIQNLIKDALIFHYAGGKPWKYDSVDEMSSFFWSEAIETPYYEELLMDFNDSKIAALERNYKFVNYYKLASKWIENLQKGYYITEWLQKKGYHSIAIYGMGYLGKRLYDEIVANNSLEVFAVDQNADTIKKIGDNYDVYCIGEVPRQCDCLIITPYLDGVDVSNIKEFTKSKVYNLDVIIHEINNYIE